MAKGVVVKIGTIFCAEIDGQYKVFFQFVARDLTQLNSPVIRVFKTHYFMDYIPNLDEIVQDDVDFYAHLMIRQGLWDDIYYKVGTHKDVGDVDNIGFRLFSEGSFAHMTKSYNWRIWKINQERIPIGELTNKYRHLDIGWLFPYYDIIAKIKTGKYLIKELD